MKMACGPCFVPIDSLVGIRLLLFAEVGPAYGLRGHGKSMQHKRWSSQRDAW